MFHFKRTFAGQLNCVWVFLSNFLFASDVFCLFFFVPNIKFSHGVITPQTWIEGKWLKCEQQLQTQCCDIQKKKGRRRNKAVCFHHPHTSALWTQSHLSLCCLHAADRISTRVILRIQSYQHACIYITCRIASAAALLSSFVIFVIGR